MVPGGHASHKNCVSIDEYFPAAHGRHVLDPAVEVVICKQDLHSRKVWAPKILLYFPAAQDWHVLAPNSDHLPAGHSSHAASGLSIIQVEKPFKVSGDARAFPAGHHWQ